MPIYAYKCESCGHTKDVLQKMSDAPLTDCPQCGAAAFKKQVTAAGFQLKGSGWYVTDFRGGSSTGAPAPSGQGADAGGAKSGDSTASATSSPPATATPAAAAPAAASSPAPASSTSSAGKGSS
ncbi:FmdB family zinc ribbon protein [Polaromonas sp.]|uniref:FmdB family zinc ribbon protein n=1 Tax=Polaromonas sp. TaxID=1869339 RepID=UPI003BAAE3E7